MGQQSHPSGRRPLGRRRAAQTISGRSLGLVGHPLGGRVALLGAAAPAVARVVARSPLLYPGERPTRTRARVLAVADGKHAMLRSGRRFDRYAAVFTAAVLLGGAPCVSDPVARALEVGRA